jgi:hypothetical protein
MSSHVRNWSADDVQLWLEGQGLEAVGQVFRDSGINGVDLLNLSDEDMQQILCLNPLQIRKIRAALAAGAVLPQQQLQPAQTAPASIPASSGPAYTAPPHETVIVQQPPQTVYVQSDPYAAAPTQTTSGHHRGHPLAAGMAGVAVGAAVARNRPVRIARRIDRRF